MSDPYAVSLEDADILDEVQLTATLMVAANTSTDHLSVDEIDRLLGI